MERRPHGPISYIPLLPGKPPHMSRAAWHQACAVPHCARLLSGMCSTPCSLDQRSNEYRVECDHILPKAAGGRDESGNYQWLCRGQNQRKGTSMDARYGNTGWFDQAIDTSKLRPHQKYSAWDRVFEFEEQFASANERLFDVFFLHAWVVGAGKTIGSITSLFAINNCINRRQRGQRRVMQSLFLVHQRELVKSIKEEIETDLVKYGITDSAPRVLEIKQQADWDRVRTGKFDIAVACTQSVWPEDDQRGCRFTTEELAEKLAVFEAVIVDECHFATAQWLQLIQMMPKAFKIASTATPMNGKGEFFASDPTLRDRLIVLSLVSYETVAEQNCLKVVLPFEDGFSTSNYVCIDGGDSVEVQSGVEREGAQNTTNPNNLIAQEVAIARAATDMRTDDIGANYASHALIKVNSIEAANSLAARINGGLSGKLDNSGNFTAAALHSGAHPKEIGKLDDWMAAKKNSGTLMPNSRRFLVTCQTGQFGLNNFCCDRLIWIDPSYSLIDIIQRLGRCMRGNTGTPVKVYWTRAHHEVFAPLLAAALEYILDMETKIRDAGFVFLEDWAMETNNLLDRPVTPSVLTRRDRRQVEELVGQMVIDGVSSNIGEFEFRMSRFANMHAVDNDSKRRAFEGYASSLRIDNDERRKALGVPNPLARPATSLVVKQDPPLDYSDEELLKAIDSGEVEIGPDAVAEKHELIADPKWRKHFVWLKQKSDRKSYAEPIVTRALQSVLREEASRLCKEMGVDIYEIAIRCVNNAAAWYFHLDNVRKATVEAHEAHYVSALEKVKHIINVRAFARALFVKKAEQEIPGIAALYSSISEEAASQLRSAGDGDTE